MKLPKSSAFIYVGWRGPQARSLQEAWNDGGIFCVLHPSLGTLISRSLVQPYYMWLSSIPWTCYCGVSLTLTALTDIRLPLPPELLGFKEQATRGVLFLKQNKTYTHTNKTTSPKKPQAFLVLRSCLD